MKRRSFLLSLLGALLPAAWLGAARKPGFDLAGLLRPWDRRVYKVQPNPYCVGLAENFGANNVRTEDGRPFARDPREPDDELAYWFPEPPRHGDPVYCCGARIGTVHGDLTKPGGGCVREIPAESMPPKLAAHVLATCCEPERPGSSRLVRSADVESRKRWWFERLQRAANRSDPMARPGPSG